MGVGVQNTTPTLPLKPSGRKQMCRWIPKNDTCQIEKFKEKRKTHCSMLRIMLGFIIISQKNKKKKERKKCYRVNRSWLAPQDLYLPGSKGGTTSFIEKLLELFIRQKLISGICQDFFRKVLKGNGNCIYNIKVSLFPNR